MNDSYVTGIATLNPSTTSSTVATFTAYDPTGALLSGSKNPSLSGFNAEVQGAIFDWQLFGFSQGAARIGSVMATSLQKLVGFFLIFDPLLSRVADGVDVSADTFTNFYFLRHQSDASGQATYQVFNPGVNTANVTASLFSTGGTLLTPPKTSAIPPKGQFLFNFNNVSSSSGYVRVQSDFPVTGLETWGRTEIAALRAAAAGTEAHLFFPHIAINGGYSSILGVVNTSNSIANLTLTAYQDDGSVWGTAAQRVVSGNGQLLESASSLFGLGPGNTLTGYVVVTSDQPGINGFCSFNYDNGNVHSVAAVPSQSIPRQKLLFSHIANAVPAGAGGNYLTGIALLNPYATTIRYTMSVFDGSGAKVAEVTNALGPHAKISRLLSYPVAGAAFFTQPLVLSGGHIEVTTDYQLLGFELFFTDSLTQLAAVMAQFPN